MKNCRISVATTAIFFIFSFTPVFLVYQSFAASCVPPPSGMISWWGGDNNTLDMVSMNYATLMNGATYAPGKVGQAFSFDGLDDYVLVNNDAALNPTNEITVGAWINAAAWGAYFPMFVSKGINESYFLSEYGDAPGNQAIFRIGMEGVVGTSELQTDTWYYIVGTYDGTDMKIYVNGNLEGTTYRPGSIPTTTTPLAIGGPANSSGYRFNGKIDEVEIYNRALSETEIQAIYNAGSYGKCRPCVAPPSGMISWWKGEDNADDFFGLNNGVLKDGATFAAGKVGQAFNFGGDGNYFQVSSPLSLPVGNSPRTMTLWFKTPGNWGDIYQVVMQYGGNSQGSKFGLYIPDYWSRTLSFWGESSDLAGSTPLQPGTWYHGAVTYDGSTVRLYLNGQFETSQDKSLNTQINSGGLTIGRTSSYDNITSQWNGLVDEAAIFNRALTAGEIAAIYNAGSEGQCVYAIGTNSPSNGSIVCNSPVASGYNAVCIITPAEGYYLSALTDNTDDVLDSVVNGVYTSPNVTETHAIAATFAEHLIKRTPLTGPAAYYNLIADAFGTANDGDEIRLRQGIFTGNPEFNRTGVSILLKGGYASGFTINDNQLSTIGDSLTITNGKITLENISVD